MVLSQPEIRQAVKRKQVIFDPPLEEEQWGEASVDLRLGFSFTRLQSLVGMKISVAEGLSSLAQAGFWKTVELNEFDAFGKRETLTLAPNDFVLAMTHERISVPRNLIALVEGRSTYARVGLSMHQTAPWVQPGWEGKIVLEMYNNGPLNIDLTPLIDRPCQLTFFRLGRVLPKKLAYGARAGDVYQQQEHPLRHRERADKAVKASDRPKKALRKK